MGRGQADGEKTSGPLTVEIRATIVVTIPVVVLRLVRALVIHIEDPVEVIVLVGATVPVRETILVLGSIRAPVLSIGNPVAI